MYSINYRDRGTPAVDGAKTVTLEIDGRPSPCPKARRSCARPRSPDVHVPKLCATDTLKAFGSCRLCLVEIEGPPRLPGVLHDARRRRHEGPHRKPEADAAPPQRDGAVHLRSSRRLRSTSGERPLRAAGHGRGARRHRVALRPRRRDNTCTPRRTRATRTSRSISRECIVCSRCVRACDEVQGTFALTIQGRGFELEGLRQPERVVPRVGMRLVRRLRRGLPDRRADREVAHPARHADAR